MLLDRPFVQGSRTSLDASCVTDSATGRARVLALLRSYPLGLTRQEIEQGLGLSGDSVRPRVAELIARDLVRPSGEIRRTVTGRATEVLEAVGYRHCPADSQAAQLAGNGAKSDQMITGGQS